jgi:homoserine kinase type II
MANFTELNENQISRLVGKYGIEQIQNYYLFKGGADNSSYKVETGKGDFVLTICDKSSFSKLETLVNLLKLLEEKDFPTSRIVNSTTGTPLTELEGKPVILKGFIEGEDCEKPNYIVCYELGKNIAKLHGIDSPLHLPEISPYGLNSYRAMVDQKLDPEFSEWLLEKQEDVNSLVSSDLPRGLIHGDIYYDNVLINNNEFQAIIDFDCALNYFKLFDIGMCIAGTCAHEEDNFLEKTHSLVQGYQSVRKLEPLEKKMLKMFSEFGAFTTASWRFHENHILRSDNNKKQRHIELKDIADKIHSISDMEFNEVVF